MRVSLISGGLLAGVLFAASAAHAQNRPNTVNMSCAQAQSIVTRSGAIVLGTGGQSYDRYVSSRAYCTPSEITKPAWVPTADVAQCFIGFRCEEYSHDIIR
jgi:hypothetical protein